MNLNSLLTLLIETLILAFPEEMIKKFIDKCLDFIEDLVEKSSTKIDDALVLPVCSYIRNSLQIPEYEEPKNFQKSDKGFAGSLPEKVSDNIEPAKVFGVYPKPFQTIKSELFVIEGENFKRNLKDFVFIGYYQNNSYYIRKQV